MKLIVGLGNPGKEYQNTRHNIGFIILDNYDSNLKWKKNADSQIAETTVNGEKIIFLKPLTYVNLSGNAVRKVANFYKIVSQDIMIIRDDLDLPVFKYKIKYNSSSGGHNGIKSIINSLNTQEFTQLKVGIGAAKNRDTKDYVLAKMSKQEIEFLTSNIFREIIDSYIEKGIQKTMNIYNTNEV